MIKSQADSNRSEEAAQSVDRELVREIFEKHFQAEAVANFATLSRERRVQLDSYFEYNYSYNFDHFKDPVTSLVSALIALPREQHVEVIEAFKETFGANPDEPPPVLYAAESLYKLSDLLELLEDSPAAATKALVEFLNQRFDYEMIQHAVSLDVNNDDTTYAYDYLYHRMAEERTGDSHPLLQSYLGFDVAKLLNCLLDTYDRHSVPGQDERIVTGLLGSIISREGSLPMYPDEHDEMGGAELVQQVADRRPMLLAAYIEAKRPEINGVEKFFEQYPKVKFSARYAECLCDEGQALGVLLHTEKFSLSRQRKADLAREVVESEGLEPLVNNVRHLPDTVIDILEEGYALRSYRDQVGLHSIEVYNQFREAKNQQQIDDLNATIARIDRALFSPEPIPEEIQQDPLFKAVLCSRFPSASNPDAPAWNAMDRSEDLEFFNDVPEVYRSDIAAARAMEVIPGRTLDEAKQASIARLIARSQRTYIDGFESLEEARTALSESFSRKLQAQDSGLESLADKAAALLIRSFGENSPKAMKESLLDYHICIRADVTDYMARTRDASSQAATPEYYHLLQLREFFADRVVDDLRQLCSHIERSENSDLRELLTQAFRKHQLTAAEQKYDRVLATHRFYTICGPQYQKEISKLDQNLELSADQKQESLRALAKRERQKVVEVIAALGGEPPASEDIDLESELKTLLPPRPTEDMSIDEESDIPSQALYQFAIELFADEKQALDSEIAKYRASDSRSSASIHSFESYVSKNIAAAHALAEAGVCVAEDMPSTPGDRNTECLWNMDNVFFKVHRDPSSGNCVGASIYHVYDIDGQEQLCVSFQPSSTFLYKVDQRGLFRIMADDAIDFAKRNGMQRVLLSKDKTIRTNRTGGDFEDEMDTSIAAMGKTVVFSQPQRFSYQYDYNLELMDVLFELDGEPASEVAD